MDFTLDLLNTNDPGSVLAGLQCLLAICRAFRYKAVESQDRQHFDKIVEVTFPRMMIICNELVNQESEEAGEMLHLALKAYKHASWVSFDISHVQVSRCKSNTDMPPSWNWRRTYAKNRTTLPGAPCYSIQCPRRHLLAVWRVMNLIAKRLTGGRPRNGRISTSTVSSLGTATLAFELTFHEFC